jgi:uncharacterized protein (TIGR02145 family)
MGGRGFLFVFWGNFSLQQPTKGFIMNRVKRSLFTAISIAMALMFFSSCDEAGGGKSDLVGRWDLVDGSSYRHGLIVDIKDMELLSDGTGIVDEAGITSGITYKIEGDRFYMTFNSGGAKAYSYRVSGSMLMLTKDDGTILTYIDVKKIKPPSFTNFTDSRNSKVYKAVRMPDGRVWFAENLNYAAEGSKCYENKEENCQKYGRLYDWATAIKVCPKGWHLPSEEEWGGGTSAMDKHLKAKEGWVKGESGTDPFGFAAIPGGFGDSNRSFGEVGDSGHWWSSTESDSSYYAYGRRMGHLLGHSWRFLGDGSENGIMGYSDDIWLRYGKSFLLSVRCVKD